MKYRIIGGTATALVLLAVFIISLLLPEDNGHRYVEHRDAPQKAPCTTHEEGILCTHLPIVSVNTDGIEIPGRAILDAEGYVTGYTMAENGAETVSATVSVIGQEEQRNHLTDSATFTAAAEIRVRGHSSRRFEKANYFIRFLNPDGTNAPQEFLGMEAHHEWALHGPFLDKTLIRNYMWYNISGEIMDYSPNVRFLELLVNGEYRGVYLATETVTAGKEGARLDLQVNKKDNTFSGYALRLDWGESPDKAIHPFTNYTMRANTQHELVYPGTQNATPQLREEIKNEFSLFEKSLYSYDFNHADHGYTKYIDIDSFVDYFLINELTCNYDAGSLSTYIYKEEDGRYKMCVWDFNSACDAYQEQPMPTDEFRLQNGLWFKMLFMDSDFTDRVIERYYELRKTYFSEEYLFGFMDDSVDYLGDAIDRNNEKWGYTYQPEHDLLHPQDRNPRSYDEAVTQMKTFLTRRLSFMDENIETLRHYSAESKTKKHSEVSD